MNKRHKFLILRFSSFGDIVASLSLPAAIKKQYPEAEVHWVTREDYVEIAQTSPFVSQVWSISRKKGFADLMRLALLLKKENYTHIYDAHNNTRSRIISLVLTGPFQIFNGLSGTQFLRRPRYRWRRFLLFNFKINLYPKPFTGQLALLERLKKWGIPIDPPPAPVLKIPESVSSKIQQIIVPLKIVESRLKVALSPSASYPLKRWPIEYWCQLMSLAPNAYFFLLGGPEDKFIEKIQATAPDRSLNLAGRLTYLESAAIIAECDIVVSNDTGLMHVAEQLGKKCLALMGPAPFGYPCREKTKIFEIDLSCRPCSKHGQGPCVNSVFQKCMVDILPEQVSKELQTSRIISK